jgi:bifunctional DNA-binding transcriptional regulator/antitoxin component of YhaV-PrlF toxin-antitoxin module
MVALNTTKLSANRKVELPEAVCQRLGLKNGTELLVFERDEGLVLVKKSDHEAAMARFNELLGKFRAHAKRVGMKRSDITRAIKEVRAENRRKAK